MCSHHPATGCVTPSIKYPLPQQRVSFVTVTQQRIYTLQYLQQLTEQTHFIIIWSLYVLMYLLGCYILNSVITFVFYARSYHIHRDERAMTVLCCLRHQEGMAAMCNSRIAHVSLILGPDEFIQARSGFQELSSQALY
jgi:hypothetical protein